MMLRTLTYLLALLLSAPALAFGISAELQGADFLSNAPSSEQTRFLNGDSGNNYTVGSTQNVNLTGPQPSPVPVPAAFILMASALIGTGFFIRNTSDPAPKRSGSKA